MSGQLFAFRVSKPVASNQPALEWRGTNKAVAQEWYCTSPLGFCGYCNPRYVGSSMTCDEWACGGCCQSCDST
jgi:hypothetical protein